MKERGKREEKRKGKILRSKNIHIFVMKLSHLFHVVFYLIKSKKENKKERKKIKRKKKYKVKEKKKERK